MKKKLHISFLGLGILVLLLSQLIALVPTGRAYAATPTLDELQASIKNYSIYAAFHSCLLEIRAGGIEAYTAIPAKGSLSFRVDNVASTVGWVADESAGDGKVDCPEAAGLWYAAAGYQTTDEMYTDLGLTQTDHTSSGYKTPGPVWIMQNLAPSELVSNLTTAAKKKGIQVMPPTGNKYFLALAALAATGGCAATITDAASAGTNTIPFVKDNAGTIGYKTVTMGPSTASGSWGDGNALSKMVAAYPDPTSSSTGPTVSCKSIIDTLNGTDGASKLGATMAVSRINQTAADIAKNACVKTGITDKTKLATCNSDFTGWAKACIKDYFTNNSISTGGTTFGTTFDVHVVATCIFGKMNSSKRSSLYKNVTLADLTTYVQAGMDGNVPADVNTNITDPCQLLPQDTQMRWLACSLLLAGQKFTDVFYNAIQSLLYTPTDALFSSDGFIKIASTFRIIGMALIIITGLVMIIAQASGSDIVDAYTVKKVLPKIGIALIGMALAWPLLKLVIGGTNDLGIALGTFMKDLAGSSASSAATNGSDVINLIATGTLGGGAAVGILAISLGGWGLLSLVGTVILALLIGLAVIAFRQLLIVMLVLLAPLAIAASVMPGTDKLWKFWRTTLLSTLMMFPIITLFLSSGRLMSSILGKMDGDPNINALMAVLVYFAPYFLLPFAFKMAGGLMANIFQIANDKGKGAFDRLRNGRGEIRKERKQRAGQGQLYAKGGMFDKLGMNNAAAWTLDTKDTAGYSMRHVPGFKRGGAALASKRAKRIQDHSEKMANALSAYSLNDKAAFAISGMHESLGTDGKRIFSSATRERLRNEGLLGKQIQTIGQLDKMVSVLGESDNIHERNAAQQLRSARGTIAGSFMDPEMGGGNLAGAGMMLAASQGYAGVDVINDFGNQYGGDALGEGDGVGDMLTNRVIGIAQGKRADVRLGYSNLQDKDGVWRRGDEGPGSENRVADLAMQKGYQDWSSSKPDAVSSLERGIIANMGNPQTAREQAYQLSYLMSGAITPQHAVEARKVYNRLSDDQKAMVDGNSGRLNANDEAIRNLQGGTHGGPPVPPAGSVGGGQAIPPTGS